MNIFIVKEELMLKAQNRTKIKLSNKAFYVAQTSYISTTYYCRNFSKEIEFIYNQNKLYNIVR